MTKSNGKLLKNEFRSQLGYLIYLTYNWLLHPNIENIFWTPNHPVWKSGFSAPLYANSWEASSHGLEVQVDANHAFNKNFWLLGGNLIMQQANMSM